jgi:hypothetical protein
VSYISADRIGTGLVSDAQFNKLSTATDSSTASTLVLRDANSNFSTSRVNEGLYFHSSSGSLSATLSYKYYYMSADCTLTLPDATTILVGWAVFIYIESGITNIKNNSGTTISGPHTLSNIAIFL